MNDYPKRGEVYLVNLNPKKGFEQGDERPAVILLKYILKKEKLTWTLIPK